MTNSNAISLSKQVVTGIVAGAVALVAMTAVVSAKPTNPAKPGASTITNLVVSSDNFDVLEAAVIQAGLAGTLDGNRQYTVFAPTDGAFVASLDVDTEAEAIAAVQGLDDETLQSVLSLHVINGRRTSTSVVAAPSYQTIGGEKLQRSALVEAGLGDLDISARNGVVHTIDSVLGL